MKKKLNIAWVCRDGYLDLFPKIEKQLKNKLDFQSFIITHLKQDEQILKKKYPSKKIEVLEKHLLRSSNLDEFSSKDFESLSKEYSDIPMIRIMWSTIFEQKISNSEINVLTVKHIKFWENYLLSNNIDLLVYERPSILSSCTAWLVCKKLKIKCIDFVDTALDTMTVVDNFNGDYSLVLEKKYLEIYQSFDNLTSEDLKESNEYLKKINTSPEKTIESVKQSEITDNRAKLSFKKFSNLINMIKDHFEKKNFYLYRQNLTKKISINLIYIFRFFLHKFINLFDSFDEKNDDNFFIYPLFMIGEFSNHIFMNPGYKDPIEEIKRISMCLPPNNLLFVKEHYSGFPTRKISDLLKIKRIKNVKLVNPSQSSFAMIKKSKGVITPGSTMGFEAMLMSKPTILLGEPWYKNVPGIKRASTVEEISEIMSKVHDFKLATERQKISIIKALFLISSEGVKLPRKETLENKNVLNLTNLLHQYVLKNYDL